MRPTAAFLRLASKRGTLASWSIFSAMVREIIRYDEHDQVIGYTILHAQKRSA